MLKNLPLIILLTAILFAACSKEELVQEKITTQSGNLLFSLPDGWVKEQPASSMRLAQYKLPGDGGKDAELALFYFPGTGGGVEDNLTRWYGQFRGTDGNSPAANAERNELKADGMRITTIYFTGTYLRSSSMMMGGDIEELPDYALLGAIIEGGGAPWFFKATGPQPTIDKWRDSFSDMLKTAKITKDQ